MPLKRYIERPFKVVKKLERHELTAGWTNTLELQELGLRGIVTAVSVRRDPTNDGATAAKVYLEDSGGTTALAAAPLIDDIVWGDDAVDLTADFVDGPGDNLSGIYNTTRRGGVRVAALTTAQTGDVDIWVTFRGFEYAEQTGNR